MKPGLHALRTQCPAAHANVVESAPAQGAHPDEVHPYSGSSNFTQRPPHDFSSAAQVGGGGVIGPPSGDVVGPPPSGVGVVTVGPPLPRASAPHGASTQRVPSRVAGAQVGPATHVVVASHPTSRHSSRRSIVTSISFSGTKRRRRRATTQPRKPLSAVHRSAILVTPPRTRTPTSASLAPLGTTTNEPTVLSS
ncbi:MAG: hypothetical protein U0235_33260 [Polyangiaceae bacterium]